MNGRGFMHPCLCRGAKSTSSQAAPLRPISTCLSTPPRFTSSSRQGVGYPTPPGSAPVRAHLVSPGAQAQETGYELLLRKQERLRRHEGGVDVRQQGCGRSISPPGARQSQALCHVLAQAANQCCPCPTQGRSSQPNPTMGCGVHMCLAL